MNIDRRVTIAGFAIIAVRDALKRVGWHEAWYGHYLGEILKAKPAQLKQVLKALQQAGYIERGERQRDTWRCTLHGRAFTLAHATRPVSRVTAERRLQEFLQRVEVVRMDERWIWKVAKVHLFGSLLASNSATVGDVDLIVELAPKDRDETRRTKNEEEYVRRALREGRHFNTFTEQIVCPQNDVLNYLKSRSRVLSLHNPSDLEGLKETARFKLLYEDAG